MRQRRSFPEIAPIHKSNVAPKHSDLRPDSGGSGWSEDLRCGCPGPLLRQRLLGVIQQHLGRTKLEECAIAPCREQAKPWAVRHQLLRQRPQPALKRSSLAAAPELLVELFDQ